MTLTTECPVTNIYRVEISGWDDNKAFFVENSELEWTEESGKQVTLSRGLAHSSVIFLRLLQPISNDRSHPVAYEAVLVAQTDEGLRRFRPQPVSSRPAGPNHCDKTGALGRRKCRIGTEVRNGGNWRPRPIGSKVVT
jgi:hypothetical protein